MHTAVKSKTLRERREALGIAQERLAQLAGVSHSMTCQLERGYTPTQSRVRDRIMKALHRLEAQREALGDEWELVPHVGRSAYRGDSDRPEAA